MTKILKLSGNGNLKINSSLTLNGKSSIHAENVEIELTDAALNISSGKIYLDNCPVIGGEINSTGECATKIIASRKFVFDSTRLTGKFISDVAYPEWFVADDTDNWAPAINQAFKTSGEVHLDCRVYEIKETIWIPPVGRLIGTSGGENGGNVDKKYGTVLLTNVASATGFNYSDNYIIKINIGEDSGVASVNYPQVGAKVANLRIDNHYIGGRGTEFPSGKKPLYGIKIAYSAEIYNVTFDFLAVAIRWTDAYADLKKITRCSFSEMLVSDDDNDYIVDFGYLGDALIFEGNGIHGGGNRRGILIVTCNSGILTSNVINADVCIRTSKGVTFSNNHMERGAQVVIDQSDVTISNNFIIKGQRPSILIKSNRYGDSAVVNMSNNQYMCIIDSDDYQSEVGICDYDIAVAGEKYFETVSGKSVEKNSNPQCVINISNELRYRAVFDGIGKNTTSGISMGTSEDGGITFKDVPNFNNRSQIYSRFSVITVFDGQFMMSYTPISVKDWNSITVNFNHKADMKFGLSAGNYYYYCQIILDYEYGWGTPLQQIKNLFLASGNHCVLFVLNGATKLGNSVMVRMIRCSGTAYDNPVYADIPLVDAFSFYDDGRVVGGYRWRNAGNFANAIFSGTLPPFKMFTLVGDTIITED